MLAAHEDLLMAAMATFSAVANGAGPDGPLAECPADHTADTITNANFWAKGKCPALIKAAFTDVQENIANAATQLDLLLNGMPDCHAIWEALQRALEKLADDKVRLAAARATRKTDCDAYDAALATFETKQSTPACADAGFVSCQDDLDTMWQAYELKGRQCADAEIAMNTLAELVAADQKHVDELTEELKACKIARLNGLTLLQSNVNTAVQEQRCVSGVYQSILAKCASALAAAEDKAEADVENLLVDDAGTLAVMTLLGMLSTYGDAIHQISHPAGAGLSN